MNIENDNVEDNEPALDQGMADVVNSLQDTVDMLTADVERLEADVERLRDENASLASQQPSGDSSRLTDLARTVSNAWNNGHPSKLEHLNTLLSMLGAGEVR